MVPLRKDRAAAPILHHADRGFAVSLMEHLVVPTFVLDAEGRVIIWNKACERLTGVPAEIVIGTSDHWRGFYAEARPCLADLLLAQRFHDIATLYTNGGVGGLSDFGVSAENWCVMPKLGHRLYLAIDAGPIYGEEGDVIAVVETLRDITAQRQAQDELEMLATRDGLTGLANRRSFDAKLAEEAKRASRDLTQLSFLMIDIDCFKLYNDANGHQRGDECLCAVAKALAGALRRTTDFCARYGGEEFAVILPSTPLAGAKMIAERLRRSVGSLGIPHPTSSVCTTVTLSIGGVASAAQDLTPARIISEADAALYRAKSAGRNRVILCDIGNT